MSNRGPAPDLKLCLVCQIEIKAYGNLERRATKLFCSRKCRGIDQTNKGVITRNCLVCSKQFNVSGSQKTGGYGKYCSSECYGITKRGPTYQFDENLQIRRSPEYRVWRTTVFERDNYTCVWCGQRGKRLAADHIKPFAYFPDLRLEIDNGRTLCVNCHYKTPTYGGRKNTIQ